MSSLISEQINLQQQLWIISIKRILTQFFQKAIRNDYYLQGNKHAFNYITHFHSSFPTFESIKLNWIFQIQPEISTIIVSYIQYNGGINNFLWVNDEIMSQQVSFLLKNVNRFKSHSFTYLISQQKFIMLRFVVQTNQLKRTIHTHFRGILASIHKQTSARFITFIPFFIIYSSDFLRQRLGYFDMIYYREIINVNHMKFMEKLEYLRRKFEQTKRNRELAFDLQNLQYNRQLGRMSQLSTLIANDMRSFKYTLESFKSLKQTYQHKKTNAQYNLGQNQKQTIVSGIHILSQKAAEMKENKGSNGVISFQFVKFQVQNTINDYDHTSPVTQIKLNLQRIQNALNLRQKGTKEALDDTREDKKQVLIGQQKRVPFIQAHLAKKTPMEQSQTATNSFANQMSLLNYIRGEKCASIGKYFIQRRNKTKIYMEIYSQNLSQFLKKNIKISISQKLKLALKITQGVWFLHNKTVCHRDLKPQNIMIEQSEGWNPKIIDFGSICIANEKSEPFVVPEQRLLSTQGYHIPYEKIPQRLKKLYSKFEYEKHQYFDSYSLGKIFQKIFRTQKGFQLQNYKQNIIKSYLEFIIGSCLDPNPMNRLSAEQIYRFLQILIEIDTQGYTLTPQANQVKK